MWLKLIVNKKIIGSIIGIIILTGISLSTYRFVYNKSQEIEANEKKEKVEAEINHKNWVAKITGVEGSQLDELIQIHKDYKLDTATLKLIAQVSSKFNVSSNTVLEALGMIDLNTSKDTKERIYLTLKKQKDKLYWLENKNSNPQDAWIKERKDIINMCRIELTLINQAQKDIEIKVKLNTLRTQYLQHIYPRVYPWKGKEGGKH